MNGSPDSKRIVRRFVDEILVRGDVSAIGELVAPDFVSPTFGFTEDGRAKLEAATQRVHASLSDIEFTINEIVAEGDVVAVRLTSSATPTGDFLGVPAAGRRYTIGEMHFFRVRDGRVVEHWHQHDALGLMKQLGASPGGGAGARSNGGDTKEVGGASVMFSPAPPI